MGFLPFLGNFLGSRRGMNFGTTAGSVGQQGTNTGNVAVGTQHNTGNGKTGSVVVGTQHNIGHGG